MSCLEHPVQRPVFTREDPTTIVAAEQLRLEAEAKVKADAEAEAQAVAQRIHFAKHYGEDFHGAINDFFTLSRAEQEVFLTPMLTGCPSTAASRIGNVLRDAAGIAA